MNNETEEIRESQVAMVTGSTRGIGPAIVERLIDDGYRVALLDINQKGYKKN